jgi:branched-chain amino acid transport system substrate-binding protein
MKSRYLPTTGVFALAVALVAGIFFKGCPESKSRKGLFCVSESAGVVRGGDSPPVTPPVSASPDSTPVSQSAPVENIEMRFSKGGRLLFTDKSNLDSKAGAEAIAQGKYQDAIASFSRAVASGRSEPEPQIYLNNAIAHAKGNPYTLAVVVPIEGRIGPAKEILRGIADAQTRFNKSGGADERLLEILIVDDGNDPDMAARVAAKLSEMSEVLGVVGHNSSSASLKALPIYEKAGIAMISPTSSSTELKGKAFFRTVPSDTETGRQLANYAEGQLKVKSVSIFFDSGSTYSKSLLSAFKNEFEGSVASEIDLSDENIDFASGLKNLPAAVSTVLLFPSTDTVPRAIAITRANAELPEKDRFQLLGGDALYDGTTLTEGGPAVEGLVLAVPWFANTSYAKDAQERWGGQVSWRTASSYDATQAMTKVLSKNASQANVLSTIREVQLSSSETSGNPLAFEDNGNRVEDPLLVKAVRGGNRPTNSEFGFNLLK